MAVIFPPQFRVLGSQAMQWEIPSGDNAIIDGFQADFASMAGTETIDIGVGAGAPQTISFAGTDTTAELVRDKINATHTGLASVSGGRVVLTDASRVRVTAYGSVSPDFGRVGLPIVDRDTAAALSTSLVVPFDSTSVRRDFISQKFDLPVGTRQVGIVATILGNESDLGVNEEIGLRLIFGNATFAPTDPIANLFAGVLASQGDPTGKSSSNELGTVNQDEFVAHRADSTNHLERFGLHQMAVGPVFFAVSLNVAVPPVPVPPGMTNVRLVGTCIFKGEAPFNETPALPANPPTLSATVFAST